jgi:hypothetical protein
MEPEDHERGVTLIMALVFLTVGSLIGVALTQLSTSNMTAATSLRLLRTVNYAADGAVEGAIQQNRYRSTCVSFPKRGSPVLQVTPGGYGYVQCVNTPIPLITAVVTSVGSNGSSATLGSPSSPSGHFDPAYAVSSQPVTDATPNIVGTISAVSSDGTSATVSLSSPGGVTSGETVSVGEEGERFDTFYACASTSSISSCSATANPEITASVLYDDIQPGTPPTAVIGYSATVERWYVGDANA